MRLSATLPVHLILLILSSLEARVNAFDDQTNAQIYSVTKRAHTHAPSLHHDAHTGASRIGDNSNFNLRADNSNDTEDVVCHPAGRCEPCPRDELDEPYCQPFGNRRLVHCFQRHPLPSSPDEPHHDARPPPLVDLPEDDEEEGGKSPPYARPRQDDEGGDNPHYNPGSKPPQTSLPAYESCGRIVEKERADFFEFVLTNVIFAALALTGVLIRSERMRAVRARRLATRIGVGLRRASGSWRAMSGSFSNQADLENERLVGNGN